MYGWGTDKNTGRLGLGYEWHDKEKENDKKLYANVYNSWLEELDETSPQKPNLVKKPVYLHYLRYGNRKLCYTKLM